jgi:cobalt/nickel transport system permease protein
MHIPDGYVSGEAAAAGWAVGAAGLALCAKRANLAEEERRLPVAGLTAAFMIVCDAPFVPLSVGTDGHLLGGTLAVALLGPWLGGLTTAVVLAVQALVFGDGGITTFGLNATNLALVPVFVGFPLILMLRRALPSTTGGLSAACGVAAFVSILVAATLYVIEVKVAAVVPISMGTVAGTMYGTYAVVGVIEAFVTAFIVRALLQTRPDLVAVAPPSMRGGQAALAGRKQAT